MKAYILVFLLALTACKKDAETAQRVVPDEPYIKSVTWKAVYAGSNASTQFTVSLVADSNLVSSVKLYLVPKEERWIVNKPQTGIYTMYDHIGDGPKGDYYYFIFYKTDGTEVKTKEFQVY